MCCIRYFLLGLLLFTSTAFATSLSVEIKNVDKTISASILEDLSLQHAVNEAKLSAGRINNLYYIAEEQITATLQALGYYHSTITSTLVEPSPDHWLATFTIALGEPTKIQDINVEVTGPGADDQEISTILSTPKLKKGAVITHADYEDTKEELLHNLHAIGYLSADFKESMVVIDQETYTAEVRFVINTQRQYVFGEIEFLNPPYSIEFLNKFLPFKPGQAYTVQKLIEFQNNLEAVDLFSKIRFDSEQNVSDPQDNAVPIKVRLELKAKNLFTGSAGYGTDTGFRATAGWLHRVPHTDGHKVQANAYMSTLIQNARLNYIIPGAQPATDKYIFTTLGQVEHFDGIHSRKAEISANKVQRRDRLESIYGISYFTETYSIVPNQPAQNKKYLLPSAKWIWTNASIRDDLQYGTRLDLGLRAGAHALLSDNNVLQAEFHGKQILPLIYQSRLILRGTLGAIASQSFTALPPSLRFFTGGMDTVRGFAYNSLGPRAIPGDPDSDNLGGRYLLVLSSEAEQKVYTDIAIVAFIDAGNAAMTTKIPLAAGAGAGVRYRTAIGTFRLDLAKPLNTVTNKHWRVHFNFGTDL